jgi:hypothetical protein
MVMVVIMMVVVVVVVVHLSGIGNSARDRERDGGEGGQDESALLHWIH